MKNVMFSIFFAVLGFELRAYALSHSNQPFLCVVFFFFFFEVFVWADFELQSS
jgi:hypothetical protein